VSARRDDRPRIDWRLSQGTRELNRPPRLRQATLGQIYSPEQEDAARPLSQISGNEQGRDVSPVAGGFEPESHENTRLSPTLRKAANRESTASLGWVRNKPALMITSPSTASVVTMTPPPSMAGLAVSRLRSRMPDSPSQRSWGEDAAQLQGEDGSPITHTRSRSPEMGPIEPLSFIPAAESPYGRSAVASTPPEHHQSEDLRTRRRVGPTKIPAPNPILLPSPQRGQGNRVSVTIAELRRMNSQVSAYSEASSAYSAASGTGFGPTAADPGSTGTKHRGGCAAKGHGSGSKAYLSMGRGGTTAGGSPVRVDRGNPRDGQESPAGKTSINDGAATPERGRLPRVKEVAARGAGFISPHKRVSVMLSGSPRKRAASPDRQSEDSLGLYDGDGFLISSPPMRV